MKKVRFENMKKMIKKLFNWIFQKELAEMKTNAIRINFIADRVEKILGNIDVSVDVNHYTPSWAVISIQGKKVDYIRFVNLGNSDIREIEDFLRHFERIKVDCCPSETPFFSLFRNKTWKI